MSFEVPNDIPIQFSRITVPTPNPYFESEAPSKRELKQSRPIFQRVCASCGKSNSGKEEVAKLLRCGKCKEVWYCSKQCQKQHWPDHKNSCQEVDGSGIQRIVQLYWANPLLRGFLEVYCVLEFDFLNSPATTERPYLIRIDTGLEPADITLFMSMFHTQSQPELPVPGMFQINDITTSDAYTYTYFAKEGRPGSRWTTEEVDDTGRSKTNLPAIFMEFVLRGEVENSLTIVTTITQEAMDIARSKSPFKSKSAIRGTYDKPMTKGNAIEFINGLIRDDKRNQLMLRFNMTPLDIEIIRAAGRGEVAHSKAVEPLLAKVKREDIYTPVSMGIALSG